MVMWPLLSVDKAHVLARPVVFVVSLVYDVTFCAVSRVINFRFWLKWFNKGLGLVILYDEVISKLVS